MTTFQQFWCSRARALKVFLSLITAFSILLLIATILYVSLLKRDAETELVVNCSPEGKISYVDCWSRGCQWVSVDESDKKTPPCFHPDGYGYKNLTEPEKFEAGYRVALQRTVKEKLFGGEVENITFQLYMETPTRLRIKITDPNNTRYEVPMPVPELPTKAPDSTMYDVKFEDSPQFGVKIIRRSTNETILDTNVPGMVFSDQYLQISTKLASANVYGLGEHRTEEFRHSTDWKKWSFFARDAVPNTDGNIYGVHPFYMNVENDGNSHGVFLHNSNAMEVELQPYPALTFRTIGGILDLYVFLGPTPEDVVKQYLEVVGRPAFPPYWGMGFQMSRWGYGNLSTFQKTIQRNVDVGLPLDVMYLDLDYAKDRMMFTYDDVNFKGLPDFVDELHNQSRKFVILLDPAIPSNKSMTVNYQPLIDGEEMNVFVQLNGSTLEGEVWPGLTYYPDFTHQNATSYWLRECQAFHETLKYDGLWIDMNEPSNFVDGSVNGCTQNNWNFPPFAAGVQGSEGTRKLFQKTICMDATQELGLHYNLHSLFGNFHANVTYHTLTQIFPSKRPFIIGRSTYSGTSQFAGHWLGDNLSLWEQLRYSIPGIMEFALFGFPLVGADICGFLQNTTEELCLRWMQLGAFYTFSRNHNDIKSIEQDPAILGQKVVTASIQALQTRYSLLPYLYTLLYRAHTTGSTVIRPLLNEFPNDSNTWTINYQFLWGPSLLISPAVYEGQKEVDAYFPKGNWYDYYTGEVIANPENGRWVKIGAAVDKVNLHVRGGSILPRQDPSQTTVDSRKNPLSLLVAPDDAGFANGSLYWDDGETSDVTNTGQFILMKFQCIKDNTGASSTITMEFEQQNYTDPNNLKFNNVTVFNQATVTSVKLNDAETSLDPRQWANADLKVLRITDLGLDISQTFKITINY